ncbi:valine--tRNA ligase [candidate division WWE3 bacterium RIFOXYD1_FULL_43_17]|uniref:Valine--tRNA ligase n=3 Tax=Katanobacteria TaxID=422282 RepID=A0A1F4XBR9_UNCKA|nr:MAG: Valine-tRNA ligase [candidate division WWE3 bacterium GW2011_GWE1_41_27]KKS60206.1 MAG: Valine-tRNA ligase [candidate division WWE3 bacterium GW2011_GWF2_42_42]OGC79155.1 MAG: valine--tRNA ligase [candidate division WWE3 bacterium RIFOXYD1_FULL_43_17]
MDKRYEHKIKESEVLKKWEDAGAFKADSTSGKKPYTIILPPPNASGKMHVGNALMIAIEDLLIRWKRMRGYEALWVPGTDHAGFESQTTYERELKKEGKSRFDYDRDTFYKMMMGFVLNNKSLIEEQIKNMGASVDWSRYTFTLEEKSINTVVSTFEKMVKDGLIYRSDYVVNYSFKYGTTFSDAEIVMKERTDPLYYIKYGPLTVATVRPETKLGDTALAVNPEDSRYKDYIGKEIVFEDVTGKNSLPVIGDSYVDPSFGTGVLKVTPAHDKNDYEIGLRHKLEVKQVIGIDGKMTPIAGKYAGMKVMAARTKIVEELQEMGAMEKIDTSYVHPVPVDYRTEDYIEQLVMPNWFIKVESLKKAGLDAVKKGAVKIYPKWQEITYTRWMENMRDWAISRQIVWGIRVPAWYSIDENPDLFVTFIKEGKAISGKVAELLPEHKIGEISSGLQSLFAPNNAKYVIQKDSPGERFLPETDTFDTWFSSGQWPLITLGYPDSNDFKHFYPTDVLETGWEIITRWVSRMIMFGIYLTGKPPFKEVYLHGRVMALDGKKMSKSLGNVINPEEYQNEFGTDALRMGLISGTANGKDFAFPKDKVLAYRNFSNKIWNMVRFLFMLTEQENLTAEDLKSFKHGDLVKGSTDLEMYEDFKELVNSVDKSLGKYRFSDAGDAIYHYMWDNLASTYIEDVKSREDSEAKRMGLKNLSFLLINCLKVLHPFMPFVTETIWGEFLEKGLVNEPLLAKAPWPGV